MMEVDSRPSDAIAVAAAHDIPLYCSDRVIDQCTAPPPSSMEERIELLRRRLAMLQERIEEFSELLDNEQFISEAPEEVVEQHRHQLSEMSREYEAIDQILKKLG
jgi:bifunctional DNase/RNase